ncbi:MAG: sigma-70 family RNA polymerase sigma factor [Gemmatimonadota bacterium]|nr:sigma-70 family RNA polymerase sigma factor [Gemmatimonadota bacterium]
MTEPQFNGATRVAAKAGEETDAQDRIEPLLMSALGPAYRFAFRLTRDETDAEDLLQEAAARACRFFHQFQPGTDFRAWLFRILANCYYSEVRRRKRRIEEVHLEDAPVLHLFSRIGEMGTIDREADPATALLDRLGADRIADALGTLPEKYRVVATLYFVQDFSYEEIATVLEIPLGTVRSRLHRGRRMLQQQLWDLAQEHGLVAREKVTE